MKTPKMFHLTVLLVIAVAPLFFPTPAGAVNGAWVDFFSPSVVEGYTGPYSQISWHIEACDGDVWSKGPIPSGSDSQFYLIYTGKTIKTATVTLSDPGEETFYLCSGYCGCPSKHSKVSYCSNFSIPKRVPQARRIPISFKGPGNITSTSIYFKELKYSLSVRLNHYDWGSGIWYGYLNATFLPLGKHHGHVTTFVDGVQGGGCATGGFKVVDE